MMNHNKPKMRVQIKIKLLIQNPVKIVKRSKNIQSKLSIYIVYSILGIQLTKNYMMAIVICVEIVYKIQYQILIGLDSLENKISINRVFQIYNLNLIN